MSGVLATHPVRLAGEFLDNHKEWTETAEALAPFYRRYDHPLYKRLAPLTLHMDEQNRRAYMMLRRIVECLQQGTPLDQNIYEGASWSAIRLLSEKSAAEGGEPQDFPDFTRGDWKHTSPHDIVS